MKFLIIRFSSIGDIVLTTPVISTIKQNFPNAKVHFLTKKEFSDVLIYNPKISQIWFFEKGKLNPLIHQLKTQQFDYIIDLHNNLRSHWVTFCLYAPTSTFNKENWKKWKMVNLKSRINVEHVVKRYLHTLNKFQIPYTQELPLEYYCGNEAEIQVNHLLQTYELNNPFLCIVLSATHFTKKWLKEYYVELIDKIPFNIVLIGGKSEQNDGVWIEKNLTNSKRLLNLCGKLSINQSAAIIKKSEWVITHDTGMMHIACAYQKKMIVLWGNTCPEIGFAPYQNPNAINISLKLDCKPCSKLGLNQCPKGHFRCMKNITPDLVMKELTKFMN